MCRVRFELDLLSASWYNTSAKPIVVDIGGLETYNACDISTIAHVESSGS